MTDASRLDPPSSGSTSSAVVLLEALGVLAWVTLWLVVGERVGGATILGGFLGWAGLMSGAGLVAGSLRRRGAPWSSIGLGRPKSRLLTVGLAAIVAVGLVKGGHAVLIEVLIPRFGAPDNSRFLKIAGDPGLLAAGLFSVWTAAAFGEEIVVRGFAMERIATVLGGGAAGWAASLVGTSVLFGFMHFYQGIAGIVITGFIGFLIGLAYLAVGRNLWVVVLAHGAVDTFALLQIYGMAT